MVHGQTTGAETGRSSGGIRVYVCVYAVNAMNHLDSFKSDVVNPTLSPSLSRSHPRSILFSLFFRFVVGTRMVGRVERSWHVRSPSFSSDSRNIRGSNRAAGRKERGERGGRSWSDRDESIRIEAWVYALLQRIALITDREGLVSRRKIASVSQSLRH